MSAVCSSDVDRTLELWGWADRDRWPEVLSKTVDVMIACRSTLEPHVMALKIP